MDENLIEIENVGKLEEVNFVFSSINLANHKICLLRNTQVSS
jgi:hypothetical protein